MGPARLLAYLRQMAILLQNCRRRCVGSGGSKARPISGGTGAACAGGFLRDHGTLGRRQRHRAGPAERTFYDWKAGRAKRVPLDTLRRIGYIAGIYKALEILYSNPAHADAWVKRPNKYFGEQTPLQRMAAGDVVDLAAVRAYVDAARAPWS
jgi:hypothetical protein